MRHERSTRMDAQIDTGTGQFDMVMATEGEASDGHIISIRGVETESEMPLQLDHGRGTISNLGIVSQMRVDELDGVPVLRGRGQIRLTGDGAALEARRDIVDAIDQGHIRGVSMTWEAIKATERRSLPAKHPAKVARTESNPRKRYGIFFEASRAIEQSIVAIPADRGALIGRSEASGDDETRQLWDDLVRSIDTGDTTPRDAEIIEALEQKVAELEQRIRGADDQSSDTLPDPPPTLDLVLRNLAADIRQGRERNEDQIRDGFSEALAELTGSVHRGQRYPQAGNDRPR